MNIKEDYKNSLKMMEVEEFLDLILYRPLALVFVRTVYRTPITPNGVTFLSFLSGLAAAYCFAQGTASGLAWGGIWYATANVLDCSDGQLARLQGSGTPLGRLVDGVVDWAISVAIFSGLAIGMQKVTGDASVWYFVVAAGLTSALHAFMFDLYQQQFIAAVRGQRNFVDKELEKIRPELVSAHTMRNKPLRKIFLGLYVAYLEGQRRSRSPEVEGHQYPPELFRAMNKNVMRFWTLLGPTTNRSLLVVAGLLNNPWLFIWPVLIIGNILLVVALVWQGRVLRRLDQTTRDHATSPSQNGSLKA
jgi:phosphatidylglycerophosphate synthase